MVADYDHHRCGGLQGGLDLFYVANYYYQNQNVEDYGRSKVCNIYQDI